MRASFKVQRAVKLLGTLGAAFLLWYVCALAVAPAPAWAQPLAATELATQAASIQDVRALIEALPATPDVVEADGSQIQAARAAYEALNEDEQRLLDTETNRAALGTTQSYGRVLELAEAGWAVLHPVDDSTALADGIYIESVSSSWNRGKSASKQDRDWVATRVRVQDGKAQVTLRINSSTYSQVRASGLVVTRAALSGADESVFTFPVSLGTTMTFVAYSQTMAAEIAYNLNVAVASGALPDKALDEEDGPETPEDPGEAAFDAPLASVDQQTGAAVVERGSFTHPEVKGYMFRMVDPVVVRSDGNAMTVTAQMPSASYSHLFVGTAEQADAYTLEEGVAAGVFIPARETQDDQGTVVSAFEFPLASLDRTTQICVYSVKNKHWVDQEIRFNSADLAWRQTDEEASQLQIAIEALEALPARNTIVPDNPEHEAAVQAARDAYESLDRLRKSQVPSRLTLLLEWDESMFDLGFNTEFLPLALVGRAYDGAIYVSGKNGQAGKTVSVVEGALPDGLALSMDEAGLWARIEGTPLQLGTWDFAVQITNGKEAVSKQFTLHVGYAPTILTAEAAPACVGSAYEQVFEADAYPDATWSLVSGSLPAGLAFSDDGEGANTARIAGTPAEVGTFSFTLACDNFANGIESQSYTLLVDPNPAGTVTPEQARAELDQLKQRCDELAAHAGALSGQVAKLEAKIAALESRLSASVTINAKKVGAKTVKSALKKAHKPNATKLVLGKKVKKVKKRALAGTKVRTLVVQSSALAAKQVKGALAGSKVKTVKVKLPAKTKASVRKKLYKAYWKAFSADVVGKKIKLSFA